MPDRLGRAIRAYFDDHLEVGRLAYAIDPAEVLARHRNDGVDAVWNLPYAHKPGMSDELNAAMAEVASAHTGHGVAIVTGATTHPGDDSPGDVVRRAHEHHGARVVKLHCSVGGYHLDDARLNAVYTAAGTAGMPVVVHVGRHVEGHTAADELEPVRRVAQLHPETILVVAHCGHISVDETLDLMAEHGNVWADLTPVVSQRPQISDGQLARFADRLLLGSDAPNTAVSLAQQLSWLRGAELSPLALAGILGGNAHGLVGVEA